MADHYKYHGLFTKHNINQAGLARACGVGSTAILRFVKTGELPVKFDAIQRDVMCKVLIAQGVSRKEAAAMTGASLVPLKKTPKEKKPTNTGLAGFFKDVPELTTDQDYQQKDSEMLPRKATLSKKTLTHFGLKADPLHADIESASDVFLTPDMREVMAQIEDKARHGGVLAIVGESGSGKTTLKELMIDRLTGPDGKVVLIEPYVQAMEDNDQSGKTLKAASIAYACIKKLNPLAKPKRDGQARFEQLHQLLKDNANGGNHALLVIEEAHCLPIPTLKHLKRFLEFKDGFKKLISVVLIGQTELGVLLNPKNVETRELSQRTDVMHMLPLNEKVGEFLKHKFKKQNVLLDALFEKDAIEALVQRLAPATNNRGVAQANNVYPLAVCNLAAAALNDAAALGFPKVTAGIMREVRV